MAEKQNQEKQNIQVKPKKKALPNPQINLDAETSQKAANEAMEAAQQLAFLSKILETGTCSKSSVETHLTLTRSYYENLSNLLGGKDVLDKEHDEMARMLRDANEKIRSMEKSMGEKADFETVMAGFKSLCNAFESWYTLAGLHYANVQHAIYGITADFSHELEFYDTDEARAIGHFGDPVLKTALLSCQPMMDFTKLDIRVDGTRYELLDTEKNKKYIRNFVLLAFPKAYINGFTSRHDRGDYLLRFSMHITWEDLNEWKQRMIQAAKNNGGCRTGRVYRDRIDARAKLNSKSWNAYATSEMIENTRRHLELAESLISYYEGILQMPDNIERANAMAKFLAKHNMDLIADFEGDLYG